MSMSRSYKWLGGIGYILLMIPFVNLVGYILVGIAWIMAGTDVKQGLFKATGIIMIITMVLSGVMIALFFPTITYLMSGLPFGEPSSFVPPRMFEEFFGAIGLFLILGAVMAVLGLIEWILELVSHFRAASVYNVKWFRRAGWMRIITVIIAIIVIAALIFLAFSTSFFTSFFTEPSGIFNLYTYMLALIIPGLLGLISIIFSAISFFSIPEIERESQRWYPPPPPP